MLAFARPALKRAAYHADNIAAALVADLAEVVLGVRTARRRVAALRAENARLRAELARRPR